MNTNYIFKNIKFIDENFDEQFGSIYIEGSNIKKIFITSDENEFNKNVELKKIIDDKKIKIIDGKNKLLLPGFYNNHAHSAMTLLRGYAENLNLGEWLTTKIFPFEDKLNENSIKAGINLSILESLKNGIVSIRDMYFFPEISIKTYIDSDIKVNFGRAIVDDNGKKLEKNKYFIEAKNIEDFVKNNNNFDKVKIDYSLHAEYTSTKKLVAELSDFLKNKDNFFNVHISETKNEVEECIKRHGVTPVKYFYDLGLLNEKTIGAHLVFTNDEDINILKESKGTVVINPISNLKLGSGISRLKDFYENNIRVTVGTDSVASNNSLNIINEIKIAKILQAKEYSDFSITPKQLLRSLTREGALSQARSNSGLIKENFTADLILIDLDSPNMHPTHNLLNNILFSMDNSNILMTMVDGKILYDITKENEFLFLDKEKIYFDCDKELKRIKDLLSK